MRILTILIAVIAIASCKPSTVAETDASAAIPKSEADLGVLYQYYHTSPSTLEEKDENTLITYLADHNYDAQRTISGVYIVMKETGTGPAIKWGDPIKTDYKGTFLDGKEFDSSYKRGKPLAFRVGQMIPGWNEALLTRRKGDKFLLLIPSHMAYGKRGFPGAVPPDSNLMFDISVLDES